jgi:pimeloyl-ACP methyl ester carboxylesterase
VRGEQDTLIPAAEALTKLMPKAEQVVLAGAGHLPLEVPEDFSATVARWLE